MDFDGTDISTSSAPHELVCVRMYIHVQTTLQNRAHINDTQSKEVYTTQVQVSMSTVPM